MRRIVTQSTETGRIHVVQMPSHSPSVTLSRIQVVLSHPTHSGNIGAVARAMKNMGLSALRLVAPEADPLASDARARAAGADDVLASASVYSDLSEALSGSKLVIGSSARSREIVWPTLQPREAAQELVRVSADGPVSVVFGQERMGLTNDELDHCHYVIAIPANPAFPSLNLAAAVQIIAYELMLADGGSLGLPLAATDEVPATHDQLQAFYRHLEEVLNEVGFFGARHPEKLKRRLIRLFNRARLADSEVSILRGILTSVQQSIGSSPDRMTRT